MPLTHTDTDLSMLRINNFATLADYREAYNQGLIDGNEISFIDENLQADWNQTDPNEPDYIKNKPDIGTGSQVSVGTGLLTITQDGVVVGTFSANSDADKTIDITSSGGGGTATALSDLNDVNVTSVSGGQILKYNSTSSKWENEAMPNIPSAANTGVLTIQRNGVTMGTFGADDSANKSVNVTVSTVAVSGSYNDLTDKPTLAEDFNCNFTITPDPNASEDTEFPSNTTVTCDKTPAEIFSASEGGKNIVAKIDTSSVISELGTVSVFDNFITYMSVLEVIEEGTTISLVVFNCRCWVVMGYSDFLLIGNVAEDSWQIEYAISSTQYESLKQLKVVATSGYYRDLTGKPQINTDNSASLTVSTNETLLGYGTPLNLHRVSKTGLYSDLIGTPTIPSAANSGILTITANGSTTIGTFGANDASNKTIDITIPSGANSGLLTIKRNTVTVGTFSANDASNKEVNITVPTSASDVNALPSSTKYGSSMSLSISTSNYVVTAQLKDQDGNNLGSAQTIDLPLESVVVNGSYDNSTKKVVLTLQNGSTVDFSVADLVNGLQSEITSSNKLSADLVQDGTTNKAYTATEKTKLSGIAEGAEVNVQSDWTVTDTASDAYILHKPNLSTVATTGKYSDLIGTPTIPAAANNGTLTIQRNSVTVGTFTADSSASKTVNIAVPSVGTLNTNNSSAQSVNSSESLSGTVNLHKVAKTGSYNDLIGTPTIPAAAGTGVLTLTKNTNTTVGTFSANEASNKTLNIPVNELPTVSSSDNGKVLQVVNGAWTVVTPITVYSGSGTPNNSMGNNGDIYIQS